MTAQVVARAFIGRLTKWDGDCPKGEGVYHACDGRPARLGAHLFWLFRDTHPEDMDELLKEIVDKHPSGWFQLEGWDCFCCSRKERAGVDAGDLQWVVGEECEWAYFIDLEGEDPVMVVARRLARRGEQAGEAVQERWGEVAVVFLNGKEPNWEEIERAGRERHESA
jgi:hypothetical protein